MERGATFLFSLYSYLFFSLCSLIDSKILKIQKFQEAEVRVGGSIAPPPLLRYDRKYRPVQQPHETLIFSASVGKPANPEVSRARPTGFHTRLQ